MNSHPTTTIIPAHPGYEVLVWYAPPDGNGDGDLERLPVVAWTVTQGIDSADADDIVPLTPNPVINAEYNCPLGRHRLGLLYPNGAVDRPLGWGGFPTCNDFIGWCRETPLTPELTK